MKRSVYLLLAITITIPALTRADYTVSDRGTWPDSWPKELEPLRGQSRSALGPMILLEHYDIPFNDREQFEAAWSHLLEVKSEGAFS